MLCFVARSNDKVLRFPIPRSEARIGRSPTGNDIVLPFHGVSRTHALLTRSEAGFRLTDLGSKNGVLVDGTRVPDVLLQPGIGVQIGSAVVSIEEGHTSDFDIAFSVRTHIKASASEPRTATLIERASEADALKLVRDIERGDGRSARDLAEQIVTRACRILRAASVRLLAIDDDVAIAA